MKSIEAIINEIKASEALQQKLAEAAKNNAYADFLKEIGWEGTTEEFIAAMKGPTGELSNDELDNVSGGCNKQEAIMSACSLGSACIWRAIRSAAGSGTGNGSDGRILCNDD